jgi:glycosyltransferase involved in cell wall biosynthesis
MRDLIVFSVLKNAIQNGYPFVETYSSWFDHCDQVFVLDGESTDGTDIILKQLAKLSPKFAYATAPWPKATDGGSSIAAFTNQCLDMVRGRAQRLLYVQADEIFAAPDRRRLSAWRDGAVELTRYILFWNSFFTVLRMEKDDAPERHTAWKATRLFPATTKAVSVGDGLSFRLDDDTKITSLDIEVFHYGWNFPVNILQKHISHGALYRDSGKYRKRAREAARLLARSRFTDASLAALDPNYLPAARPFRGEHPECVRHLLGKQSYDPYVALSLLKSGVRW